MNENYDFYADEDGIWADTEGLTTWEILDDYGYFFFWDSEE